MQDYKKYFEANQKLWDARVEPHLSSDMYEMDAFRKGKNSLQAFEIETLGSLEGKTILHLQCHFGKDTISLCRLGADRAVGVDLSPKSIATAIELAEEFSVPAEFICSNVYDVGVNGQFDMVYTSFGATPWLPDLDRWAQIINQNLKPGGQFYFVEFHPLIYIFDFETKEIKYDYFYTQEPIVETAEGSYAGEAKNINLTEYSWNHGISEIINPLLKQGLMLKKMNEFDYSSYNCFENMKTVGKDQYVFDIGIRFPHMLEMLFEKPIKQGF